MFTEMKAAIILGMILLLGGCINSQKAEETHQWDGPQHAMESVMAIPDSVATVEQLALKQALLGIMWNNIIIEKNRMVFTADREMFIEQNIPPSYYDLIQASIKESNEGLDRWEREGRLHFDLEEVFERDKKEYLEQKEKDAL